MSTPVTNSRRGFTLVEWIVIAACLCIAIALILPSGIELPFRVLFGWIFFGVRAYSDLRPNGAEVLTFSLALVAVVTILHLLFRSFFNSSTRIDWKFRRTISTLVLFVLSFVSGTVFVGTVQHLRWLSAHQVLDYSDFERSEHSASESNLRKIAEAVNSYRERYSSLPVGGSLFPGAIPGHSWQTALLPMLDQQELYNRMHLDQPWDAEVNQPPCSTSIPVYTHPLIQKKHPQIDSNYAHSHYAGNCYVLPLGRSLSIEEIKDGASQTILAGEVSTNFKPWADPRNSRDPKLGLHKSANGFGSPWGNSYLYGTHFLMVDGSVRSINDKTDPKVLKALATPDGGENIEDAEW